VLTLRVSLGAGKRPTESATGRVEDDAFSHCLQPVSPTQVKTFVSHPKVRPAQICNSSPPFIRILSHNKCLLSSDLRVFLSPNEDLFHTPRQNPFSAQTFYLERLWRDHYDSFGVLAGRQVRRLATLRFAGRSASVRVPAHKLGSLSLAEIKGWSSAASQRLSASV
jgi:hypothetical protein